MDQIIRNYMSRIGQRGGRKSRRALAPDVAKDMVRLREARKAFRDFFATCFWFAKSEYRITLDDIPWVAEQLMKHGGHEGWKRGSRLCR